MKIAIHVRDGSVKPKYTWTHEWIEYCKDYGLDFEVINCFRLEDITELSRYDCLLWKVQNYVLSDMLFARGILYCAKMMGLKTFPDFDSLWHFDDKISGNYLLKSIGATVPDAWMFYKEKEARQWIKEEAKFPIIAKLKSGSGAMNVCLIKNYRDALKYTKRMFNGGIDPCPKPMFKLTSNIRSAKSWNLFMNRFKRIPEFLRTYRNAKEFPKERGYVYFQEYIPNDGFDIKLVTVGDKASYVLRSVRKGGFRASGGGDLFYTRDIIGSDIIRSAFGASDRASFMCMGYDFVIDKRNNKGKIVEISYGFSHNAIIDAGGYWDNELNWHQEPLNVPVEIIRILCK